MRSGADIWQLSKHYYDIVGWLNVVLGACLALALGCRGLQLLWCIPAGFLVATALVGELRLRFSPLRSSRGAPTTDIGANRYPPGCPVPGAPTPAPRPPVTSLTTRRRFWRGSDYGWRPTSWSGRSRARALRRVEISAGERRFWTASELSCCSRWSGGRARSWW